MNFWNDVSVFSKIMAYKTEVDLSSSNPFDLMDAWLYVTIKHLEEADWNLYF